MSVRIGWASASSSEYSCCSSSKRLYIAGSNKKAKVSLSCFIDEKQLNLLQQQTINKENIGHNYQGDNESTIICSNPVTSRWCGCPSN
ncbi:unnamed protein product [Rhizophagus irregularis]|nr:unnamed protein product [Rhizophagus irregularis]